MQDLLDNSSWFRHLMHKVKNLVPCKVITKSGREYVGIIKSMDVYYRGFELITTDEKTVYINWRHIESIEFDYVPKYKEIKNVIKKLKETEK